METLLSPKANWRFVRQTKSLIRILIYSHIFWFDQPDWQRNGLFHWKISGTNDHHLRCNIFYFSRILERILTPSTSRKTYANLSTNQIAALLPTGNNVPFDTENFSNLESKNLAEWKACPVYNIVYHSSLFYTEQNYVPLADTLTFDYWELFLSREQDKYTEFIKPRASFQQHGVENFRTWQKNISNISFF